MGASMRSPFNLRLIAIWLLLLTVCDKMVAGMPHPAAQQLQQRSEDIDQRLSRSSSTKAITKGISFSPQPQYIVLTPPLLQHDVQQHSAADEVAPLSAKTLSRPAKPCHVTHAASWDSSESKEMSVTEDASSEDWEAWREQFQAQLRERRCRRPGADCSARRRR